MIDSRYNFLLEAVEKFGPLFSMVISKVEPVAHAITLDELISEITEALKLGWVLNPPAITTSAGEFAGLQLILTEPSQPNLPPVKRRVISIHTNLSPKTEQVDQFAIAYAIIAVAVGRFVEKNEPAK